MFWLSSIQRRLWNWFCLRLTISLSEHHWQDCMWCHVIHFMKCNCWLSYSGMKHTIWRFCPFNHATLHTWSLLHFFAYIFITNTCKSTLTYTWFPQCWYIYLGITYCLFSCARFFAFSLIRCFYNHWKLTNLPT